MRSGKSIFDLVFLAIDSRNKFIAVKNDEVRREKCVSYGVYAIVLSVVNPLVLLLSTAATAAMFEGDPLQQFLLSIFILVAVLFLAILSLIDIFFFTPAMFIQASRQLRLKRKVGGVIGLITSILSLGAEIYVIISFFSAL